MTSSFRSAVLPEEFENRTSVSRTAIADAMAKAAEAAELGSWALAAKTAIVGRALLQLLTDSALEIQRGNITRAIEVVEEAVSQAEQETIQVDAKTTGAAARSIGILLVFVFIASCWGLELFLTKGPEVRRDDEKEQDVVGQGHFLPALNFSRYLMSWFVVMNNFYQLGSPATSPGHTMCVFARWGSIGIPWFFLVSGFCHTYSALVKHRVEALDEFFYAMVKKVATWYPIYIFSLTWCALRYWSIYAEDWAHYMANVLLIQGLIWETEGFPYMLGDWWLSFLMVYLLAWTPMHQVLVNSTNSVLWTLFTLAFAICVPSAILEWYFMGDLGLFVLIQYWPAFVFGQALATWFVRNCMIQKSHTDEPLYAVRPVHEIPTLVRFGVTLSFFVLGIMFFVFGPNDRLPLLRKSISPLLLKGGLLPLLGLMVASLACEVDPISKLFARTPFRWTEKLAFANFILQVPIHNTVKDWTGWNGFTWTFSGCLLLSSILGHVLLERPWRRLLGERVK